MTDLGFRIAGVVVASRDASPAAERSANLGARTYGTANGGILGLLSALKLEAERYGIRVSAVAPMAQTCMAEGGKLSQYTHVSLTRLIPELCPWSSPGFASGDTRYNGFAIPASWPAEWGDDPR